MNILEKYRAQFQADGPSGGGTATAPGTSSTSDSGSVSPSPSPADANSGGGAGSIPTSPSSSEEVEGVDFSSIFGDGEEVAPLAPEPSPAPAAAPPAAVQPAAGAEPAPGPTLAPAPAPGAPAAPASTDPASAPSAQLDPYDPGALFSALQKDEKTAVQHVAETMFKLSAEEIEALESNTVEVIPQLLAKGFVKAQMNMFQQMSRMIPAMMQKQTQMMQKHSENENKFYARWPDLKKDQHGNLVMQYASVYRQMNPSVSLEEMIEAVGPMVMMAAKVQPSLRPASPGAPAAVNGVRPAQPSPFVPAGAASGGASPATTPELSPVEAMFVGDPSE